MTTPPSDLEAPERMPTEETWQKPLTPSEHAGLNAGRDTVRDAGAVLDADPTGTKVRLWVHGVTPYEGIVVDRPEGLPKWMAVAGATFDAWGVDTVEALSAGVFTKHSVDEEAPFPPNSAEEAERLRAQLRPDDWQRYQDSLEAAPAHRAQQQRVGWFLGECQSPEAAPVPLMAWVKDLREAMRTRRPARRSPRSKSGKVLKPKGDAGKLVPAAPASPQHAEGTSGGWLCHYPIRRPNGTLLKLCENRVSAEGERCYQHPA